VYTIFIAVSKIHYIKEDTGEKKMKNNIYNFIARTAIDYAHITPEEVLDISMRQTGTIVEVDFQTEWMHYICQVNIGGAVMGFFSEPVRVHKTDGMKY